MKTEILVLSAVVLLLGACKKKEAEEAPAAAEEAPATEPGAAAPQAQPQAEQPAQEKLAGASSVRQDLKSKNYSRAVERLLLLRSNALSDEQWIEYRELNAEVGQVLAAAAATDQNAAAALRAYRVAMFGR
ncbi:MAG: hypothetical protein AB1813_13410 [Verrucomicrobiota bacterium]